MNVSFFIEMKSIDGNNDGGGVLGDDNVFSFGYLSVTYLWNYILGSKIC